jgi:hypothetical protein
MGQRTSVYLDDGLQAAVKASGVPPGELIRRGLGAEAQPTDQPADNQLVAQAATSLAAIGPGEPSPGVACAGSGCWQRNTSRFGLSRVPLCPSCHTALEG